jgi:glycosyltransferase involved in cell wall biosynthesis
LPEFRFAVPGDLDAPTGGYAYARRLLREAPELAHLALPAGFPYPDDAAIETTRRRLAAAPARAVLLIDGLALGALPARVLAPLRRRIVALVHHPLCLECTGQPERAATLRTSETTALAYASRVIATSAATARLLAHAFDVPPTRLRIATPGCDPLPRAHGTMRPPRLLSVGAVIPRKGYDLLIEAVAALDGDWRLTIAGALDRDPDHVRAIRAMLAASGLDARITLTGVLSDQALRACYARADLFVSASRHEGYGMAAAAALSAGLPIVCTDAGALADTVPSGAGLIVPAGDPDALRAALRRMLADDALRARRAAASWRAGRALPRWDGTARRVRAVLRSVAADLSASEPAR